MSVILTAPIKVGGVDYLSGTGYSGTLAFEAELVNRGVANWDGANRQLGYGANNSNANTITLLGDSLTYQSQTFESNGALSRYTDRGYFTFANMLLRRRLHLLANRGVSGQTSAQILARIGDVLADNPGWCSVLAGTNDVLNDTIQDAATSAAAVATCTANLQNIYAALRAAGIKVIALTLPANGSSSSLIMNKWKAIAALQINDWIRNYCKLNPGMVLVDAFAVTVNPDSAWSGTSFITGKTGAFQADLIHLARYGAYLVGKAFYNAVNSLIPQNDGLITNVNDVWDSTNYPSGKQLLPYTTFPAKTAISATGITGFKPNSGSIAADINGYSSMAAALDVVASTDDVPHQWWQAAVSGSSGINESLRMYILPVGSHGTSYNDGDTIYGECEIDVSSATNLVSVVLRVHLSGPVQIMDCEQTADTTGLVGVTAYNGVLRTPKFTLAAGQTITAMYLYVTTLAAGGATVKWRRPALRKV